MLPRLDGIGTDPFGQIARHELTNIKSSRRRNIFTKIFFTLYGKKREDDNS